MRPSRVLLFVAALVAGCYQQPQLSRDRPLKCTGADAGNECPVGFSCIAGVCATKSCRSDLDCPMILVCGMRGCALPVFGPGPDGGLLARGPADASSADASATDATPDSGGN